jgi:ketopantoate reductase
MRVKAATASSSVRSTRASRIAVVGAGAVGLLRRQTRRAAAARLADRARRHLRAIRERGRCGARWATGARQADAFRPRRPVDLVILAVKTYANAQVLPLPELCGPGTIVLTLQNGVASADALAGAVGEGAPLRRTASTMQACTSLSTMTTSSRPSSAAIVPTAVA